MDEHYPDYFRFIELIRKKDHVSNLPANIIANADITAIIKAWNEYAKSCRPPLKTIAEATTSLTKTTEETWDSYPVTIKGVTIMPPREKGDCKLRCMVEKTAWFKAHTTILDSDRKSSHNY